jgi:hypothetical protein
MKSLQDMADRDRSVSEGDASAGERNEISQSANGRDVERRRTAVARPVLGAISKRAAREPGCEVQA